MILLKNHKRPQFGIYILAAGCICFMGATILAYLQVWFIHLASRNISEKFNSIIIDLNKESKSQPSLYELTVTGPIFETLLLFILLFLLNKIWNNRLTICFVSAVIWGLTHAFINTPMNGLPSAWIFLVLSSSAYDWEDDSNKQYFAPLGIHSLSNALAYFIL